MMRVIPALLRNVLLSAFIGTFFASSVFAQGRGSDRGGLLSQLRRSDVREAIGLTAEQIEKIEQLESQSRPERGTLDPFFEKLQNAETEEQRNVIREEMNAVAAKFRQDAEAGVRSVLSPEQLKQLVERMMADRGAAALYDPAVRSELALSDAQVADLERLQAEREAAARELGRGGPEQFQAFRQEWDAKLLAVLDEEQRARWNAVTKTGDAKAADTNDRTAPAVTNSEPTAAPPTAPAQPTDSSSAETASAPTDASEPVVSFGNPKDADSADGPAAQEPLLTFNFRYAPWADVLMLFADYANLTLDLNEVPPGTFNYYDRGKYTPTEALDILNGYLLQKGYILVQRDNFLVCLNIDDGIPPNLVPNITADELPKRGLNELLNVVFPIEGVPATNAAKEVELLLGPQGKVVPLSTSNSLVVTDIGSNLRRIQRLLSSFSAGPGEQVFKLYPLKHLDPLDAENIVKSQLGLSPGVKSVSSAYEDWRRDRDRDSRDSRDSRSSSSSSPTPSASTPKVASDDRTSSLLVTATAAQHRIVEDILKATDVHASGRVSERSRSDLPYLEVYTLQRSDPQEVVKTLDVLMPGVVVNEDGRNEKIHVHAPQAVQEEVERLIRQLDGEGSANGTAVTVIPLSTLDPYAAAGTIRSLFAGDGDDAPVVEADSYGRRLMVRGTADQVAQVKTLLLELGEDGTGRGGSGYSTGPVRTIPLGGRDPEELLPLLQRLWETSDDAPLRVVPSSPGMIIERRPLGRTNPPPAATPATADTREAADRPAANFNVLDPLPADGSPPADLPQEAQEPVANEPAPEAASQDPATSPESAAEPKAEPAPEAELAPEAEPAPEADGKEPVAVTVQGGNLVIMSENDKALNRFEDLVQKLGQVIPARTKWTVFYLRTADATETAMLLEQLFPTSSVSMTATDSSFMGAFTGGLSSFGDSLMDATGLDSMGLDTQTLRIIPDIRSNSLFVTGPPDKVAEIEQVLDVLDATDLPDSLRERLPRMIDVKYADVEQVAEIVREVYKDYLQPANAAAMAGNPLALLMGGGGGGRSDRDRRDQPQGAIRLTVGVDTATSKLIVSADEALFKQIEDLVRSLDDAQLQAKRTVSVVSLENADATLVQTTLGSLIPKVRTSSTADRRSQSSNSSGSSNSSSNGSNGGQPQQSSGPSEEDQERLRRLMEMRSRFGGGDSGSDRGGDRGGDRDRDRGGDRGSRSFGRGR